MSLQLILGGAGQGKTTYVYDKIIEESIRHPEQLYFIIVPEQFTMQTQKDIVTRHPRHGTMNIDIVSFQRLAYRIFEELSVEQPAVLDDMGKSMVLRKAASSCRNELTLFSGHLGQPGFVSRLRTTISEFYQYGVTPEILTAMSARAGSPLFARKLQECAALFQAFQDYIAGHYITNEEILDALCRLIPDSQLIRRSVIVLDGYAGYMPVQYRLIELFMEYAKQVVVTVTADKETPPDQPAGMQQLFYMSSRMVCRLKKAAEEKNIKVLPDIWVNLPVHRAQGLQFLERHLFRYHKAAFAADDGSLELYQAVNPSGEISRVVHRIHEFVKQEGLRYRDIAVVTGDLDGYGKEISHQFAQSGIPCFLDDKRTMLDNPLVEMIRAALEAVRKDFSYESVFRYLRSGIIAEGDPELDRLENYVLAMGIRGNKRWRERWERTWPGGADFNMAELNAYKDQAAAPLLALLEAFRNEDLNIRTMTEALQALLVQTAAEEKMEAYRAYFESIGELRLAREYGQLYPMVQELFEKLKTLLGSEKVSRKEFAEILDAGFSEISVGVIPATVDRVVVGDIMRTRLAHVKVICFVGVNDGIIPSAKEGGSLLTDQEREFLAAQHVELAPTAREDSFQQRFFLYRMMTKPTVKLIVSWAGAGADGKSRRASYLVGDLKKMFPAVSIGRQEQETAAGRMYHDAASANRPESAACVFPEIYSLEEARRELIAGFGKYRENGFTSEEAYLRFMELYRTFASSEDGQKEIRSLTDAAFFTYQKQGIGRAVAQVLYGKVLSGSVTRLEQFAECAYAHFLKYGLELMERRQYEVNAADLGNLFHHAIDGCFRRVRESGKDWRDVTDAERTELVHNAVRQAAEEYGSSVFGSSARNEFLTKRAERITERTVWALQQQILRGDFTPVGFEVSFSAADHLDAMRIALSEDEELRLRGRIDRLDLCEDEEHVYVKIIDYKSGSTKFDLTAIYYGLQLQLVVYMDAVMEMTGRKYPGKEVVPAGIFYYNIADPTAEKRPEYVRGDGTPDREAIDREILKQLKMNGLVNSEYEVVRLLDHTIEKESDVVPVVLKNDEIQEGRSSVASRERFEWLKKYVHKKVETAGREILAGEIAAQPCRSGQKTACDYCPFHAVCGFDRKLAGCDYRRLNKKKSEEIWEEICQ